jgi:hypothetical protein
MEKAGRKAALAASMVLHAEKAEAEAVVEASVLHAEKKEGVEPSVEEPEVEDLKKADAEAMVAVVDLEKGVADVAGEDTEKA